MARIYIVEDDDSIGEIESFALKNAGHQTEHFVTMSGFVKAMKETVPDLIVLDVMLPDADGFHAVKDIRQNQAWGHIPILMVSARSAELDVVRGLDSGADDYLTKPFGVMEFVSRTNALLRRFAKDTTQEGVIGNVKDVQLDSVKREVRVQGKECLLTYKEFELLQTLMSHPDQVMTRDVLMEEIWGVDFGGESRTLDMHIRSLRKKLGEAGKHIKTTRNVGYRYEM